MRTVGAPTPTTRLTFGSHLRARRVGEAELNNALSQPRDEMHSYSPSTQALLRMLLLLLLPREREGNLPPRSHLGCVADRITNITHKWKH